MSTNIEEAWAPEPELREPAPRRLRPSEYPDLNTPNVLVFTAVGAVLLLVGIALIVLGATGRGTLFIVLGVLAGAAGGFALALAPGRAAKLKARAERLVRDGQPIMARIVTANNLTGDSTHGRHVSYMVTLPGGEVVRRDVNADDRALPKRIPGNVTALIDPRNTGDVELYCALPFRAVARPEAVADPLAAQPAAAPAVGPTMGAVADDSAPPAAQTPPGQAQEQKSKAGYQGLPWE